MELQRTKTTFLEEIESKNAQIDALRMELKFVQPQISYLKSELLAKNKELARIKQQLEDARQYAQYVAASKDTEIAEIKAEVDRQDATKADTTKHRMISELERVIKRLKAGELDEEEGAYDEVLPAVASLASREEELKEGHNNEERKVLLALAAAGVATRRLRLSKLSETSSEGDLGDAAIGCSMCLSDAALYHPSVPFGMTQRTDIGTYKSLYGVSPSWAWDNQNSPKALSIINGHASLKNFPQENMRLKEWTKAQLESRGVGYLLKDFHGFSSARMPKRSATPLIVRPVDRIPSGTNREHPGPSNQNFDGVDLIWW